MRFVAFLRGMNVGGHRITNAELEEVFGDLGLGEPTAYQASGNVVFDAPEAPTEASIEDRLVAALGYAVPTFLRTIHQVRELADLEVFAPADVEAATAAPQVALLKSAAGSAPPGTEFDLLVARGTELHWLPLRGVGRTELDIDGVEAAVGPMTVRSLNTIRRIAGKFGQRPGIR